MLTVGITTFKYRFDKYFIPLLHQIKDNPNNEQLELLVVVNGEHNENFDNTYRSRILSEISQAQNTFPIIFPHFRGLSKLWNTLMVHSTNDYILILNDDISILDINFFDKVRENIQILNTSFQINNTFSHVVLKKTEILHALGGVSEKLLGIGEEEYIMWCWAEMYGKEFPNVYIDGIINHVDFSHSPNNIKESQSGGKYSKFNRETMFNKLFIEHNEGKVHGKISEPLIKKSDEHPHQYPNEQFYYENKKFL